MANIPGISGYIQPGVFARDRVVSRGVSLPGGIRILSILGEGSREITLVESALGSGQDGVESPSGEINGRFFKIPLAPLVSGRTRLFINGSELLGTQQKLSAGALDSKFDYRVDIATGDVELKGATFLDFGGNSFSRNSSNVGLGTIKQLLLLDSDSSAESFTLRCASVVKDANGSPIPGRARFTLSGSVSGISRDSNGNQILFSDTYSKVTDGSFKRNNDETGGLVLASTSENGLFTRSFGAADAVLVDAASSSASAITSGSTIYLRVADGLGTDSTATTDDEPLSAKVLVGDKLIVDGVEYEIDAVKSVTGHTILTLNKAITYNQGSSVANDTISSWSIRAFNALSSSTISLRSTDVGKFIRIDSGNINQDFTVKAVQVADGIIRIEPYNSTESMPSLSQDETSITIELLETNGIVALGIEESTVGFSVGDKFSLEIESNALSVGDNLEARFIYSLDLNDPEFFITSQDLVEKHGFPSEDNNLTLGAQMAFENGAPGVLAVQTKPALPRRTTVTLLEEVSASGEGGYAGASGSSASPDEDDLTFTIPIPASSGIRQGRPDKDTGVNIFVVRDDVETQIFPNKVGFYNSQYDDSDGRQDFVDSSDLAYSYTIVNYDAEIISSETDGLLSPDESDATDATSIFFSSGTNFDASDVGNLIVIKSGDRSDTGALVSDSDDIGSFLFASNETHTLEITDIVDDNTVKVKNSTDNAQAFKNVGLSDIQFLLKDSSSSEETAALVINRALVRSGAIQVGDGIKISYIDNNDSDFFDANFFDAFEKLEAFETQLIVPLPKQTKSAIFQAAVRHCELMSSVPKRRERLAFIGAMQGVTPDALVGRELIAVEDIGVVEGVQGDDAEEILNEDIEDLQNFKLNDNFTSNRAVYFYPDQIVRNINGTNTFLDGFYVAAAAGGFLSATQNVAIPITNKILTGFTILRDKVYRDITLNELGSVGATVLQPVAGGGRVLAGRTTSNSGFIEDEEISIIFIRDKVKTLLRDSMKSYIGGIQDANTNTAILVRVRDVLTALQTQQVIESFTNIRVERDKIDPRQINVFLRFVPVFPINYIFIDIEVGL